MLNLYSRAENNKVAERDRNVSWIALLYFKNEWEGRLGHFDTIDKRDDTLSHLEDDEL